MASFHRVGSLQDLLCHDNRLHTQIEGRFVTVLRDDRGELHAFDSVCYHAGGPLALGDIEEIPVGPEGRCVQVIRCPWHYFQVSLVDGEKYYQPLVRNEEQKLVPGIWTSVGRKQRVHIAEERPDGLYVGLQLEGEVASDEHAHNEKCGIRLVQGTSSTHVAGYAFPATPEAAREDSNYLRNKSMDAVRRLGGPGSRTISIGEGDDLVPELLEEMDHLDSETEGEDAK